MRLRCIKVREAFLFFLMLGREGEMQESNKGKNTWLFLGHTICVHIWLDIKFRLAVYIYYKSGFNDI